MKKLLTILIILPLLSNAQLITKDTTITASGNTWRFRVTTHYDYDALYATNTFPAIFYFTALGEVGTDTSKIAVHGPHKYIRNGGMIYYVKANGDTLWPVVITIQPTAAYPVESLQKSFIDILISRYHLRKTTALYGVGYSHGGWCFKTYVTGDAYGGPYTYASYYTALSDIMGMKPDDNSPYPNLFDNYANVGGKIYFAEQINDGRDQGTQANRMNAAVAGSAIWRIYSFGDGGHTCCEDSWMGGTTAPIDTFLLFGGRQQNIYANLLSIGDTTVPSAGAGTPPTVTVDAKRTITQPLNAISLNGTATGNGGHTISSTTWTVISQPANANATIRWPNRLTSPLSNDATIYICDLEQAGTYIVQLSAIDNADQETTANDTIIVAAETFSPCHNTPTSFTLTAAQASGGDLYFPYGKTHSFFSSWQPGDTIKIAPRDGSGTPYGLLSLGGFNGNPACPTIITNTSGTVYIQNVRLGEYISGHQQTTRLSYFDFRGDGVNGITYGFNINSADTGKPCIGAAIVDHGTIQYNYMKWGAPALYLKLTPDTATANRPYVNFPNYVQRNMKVLHNYIDSTHGEGFYLGDYDRNGDVDHTDANGKRMLPVIGDTIEIAYNIFHHTKWTACQFTSWRIASLHDNYVTDYGYSNTSSHQAGLAFGGYNNGSIYNNVVSNGTGNAYQIFGFGRIYFYNNVDSSSGQQSLFGTDAPDSVQLSASQEDSVYNNYTYHPNTTSGVYRFNADHSVTNNVWYSNNQFCFTSTPPVGWETTYLMSSATTTTRASNFSSCIRSTWRYLKQIIKGTRLRRKQ